MILANTAEQATSIDPTLLAILYIFGAALVTAIAGIALAIWQSKRDHARWIRERRYDSFTRILALADRYAHYRTEGNALVARSRHLQEAAARQAVSDSEELDDHGDALTRNLEAVMLIFHELKNVEATLQILGPNRVLEALNSYTDTLEGEDVDDTEKAKDAFVMTVRKALAIGA